MKTIEIIGYKRANLGKNDSRNLRNEGNVPCVVYGGKDQIHFHSPMILFRELIYSPGANFVDLNIEGESEYYFNSSFDKIEYKINKKNDNYDFITFVNFSRFGQKQY